MSFACIFVPDFPVEAVVRAEPQLREQPVAVLHGTPPLIKVFAANQAARDHGVELGMTKLQAEICPQVALRSRSPLAEAAAHAALLDCAQSFSPNIEDTADDTVLLDLDGLERLFGPVAAIARDLARRASDLGVESTVAVASNPDAAICAARGFPGVTVIPTGKEAERLGDLPLEVLLSLRQFPGDFEPSEILETFDRWGVRNFRTLAALPQIPLSERMGQQGVRLQTLARGAAKRTLSLAEPPLHFEEAVELEYPVALLEPLAFILNRMLEQLCGRLGARALATNQLRLKMELERLSDEINLPPRHGDTEKPKCSQEKQFSVTPCLRGEEIYDRSLHFPVPMLNPKTFIKLLQLELQSHPPGAPVAKIWLSAEPVKPRAAQTGLFLPLTPEPEKLALTLARISGVVGEGRCGAPEILDTHRPEAFRMRSFAPAAPKTNPPQPASSPFPMAALRVFRPPLHASVILHAGAPVRLSVTMHQILRGEIMWAAGPWRASGDWWTENAWVREEWDIAVHNQNSVTLCRLYRDLRSGQWFVEGTYD